MRYAAYPDLIDVLVFEALMDDDSVDESNMSEIANRIRDDMRSGDQSNVTR